MFVKYLCNKKLFLGILLYLMGAFSTFYFKKDKVVEIVKVEKVRDEQAILDAVEKERKEFFKSIKKTRTKNTIKKPNGYTLITETEESTNEISQVMKRDLNLNLDLKSHEKEKLDNENFQKINFSFFAGAGIYDLNLSLEYYIGLKLMYNFTPTFFSSITYKYNLNNNNNSLFLELEKKLY